MEPGSQSKPNFKQQSPTKVITIPAGIDPIVVLGTDDEILRVFEKGFPQVNVVARDRQIQFWGPAGQAELARSLFAELITLAKASKPLDSDAVAQAISMLQQGQSEATELADLNVLTVRGRTIRPKTLGQKTYVDAIESSTIVFGIGPAGTGKTYLAMAEAVQYLLSGQVKRIVLTRPAVEAGESLGFLPGSLTEKIDPYVRPLYDALHDMIDPEVLPRLMASGAIEVAPLAYMRGRTLNDSFIILDEAQNTTPRQMKMFLTRLGFNSKVVVTGDITQVDLPSGQRSGLKIVQDILAGIEGIAFCRLTSADVVRNELVVQIIDAYDRWGERQINTGGHHHHSNAGQERHRYDH